MIDTAPDAPARWDLSAPESLVLRDGPNAKPAEVIKLAVLELVTRRVLRLVEVETRNKRGKVKTEVVIGAGSRPAPTEGPLAVVARIALEAKVQTRPDGTVGIGLPAFARVFVASHKNVPKSFIDHSVLPALESRGLYRSERRKWLRIFTYTHWERTPAGDRALTQLGELTTTAERDVAEWSERQPQRLATFLAVAGGAALLVPAAYPTFEEFSNRIRTPPDDGSIVPIIVAPTLADDDSSPDNDGNDPVDGGGGGDGSGVDLGGLDTTGLNMGSLDVGAVDFGAVDFGGIDFSALSIDFAGFSGIGGALASIDAGISAGVAGADGGGGGGGDGGGSSGT